MKEVLFFILSGLLVAIGVAFEKLRGKKELQRLEEEHERQQQEKDAKAAKAQQVQQEAHSGDPAADILFMAGKLHEYAHKHKDKS